MWRTTKSHMRVRNPLRGWRDAQMWDADTMELVMEAPAAHGGARVNCAAVGPDGNLYTGGDDKARV